MTQFWLECGQHIRNLTLLRAAFYEQSYVQNVFYIWTPNMESLEIESGLFLSDPNYYGPRSSVKTRIRVTCEPYDPSYFLESSEEESESEETLTQGFLDSSSFKERSRLAGPKMKKEGVYFVSVGPMKKCEIRENIQPNYNFRTLSVELSDNRPNCPLHWKELFVSYPNLESLSLLPLPLYMGLDIVEEVLTDLIEFQEDNPDKLQNLKHLDAWNRFFPCQDVQTIKFLEQAMKLKFKLESLQLEFDKLRVSDCDILGKYIAKLSSTLRTLDITCSDVAFTIFPPMRKEISFPNLENLSIPSSAFGSDVDILGKTPGLEKLTIYRWDSAMPRLFYNTITMLPLNSLLRLDIGVDILTEDCVRKIGEWFPNLFYFGATLDNKLLWAVYKFLYSSVEVLYIMGKGLTDAGITGMEEIESSYNSNMNNSEPKSSSPKVSRSYEPPVKRRKFSDMEVRTYIGASIGQMKKLRRIIIDSERPTPGAVKRKTQLTDDSVYNGFILLTELSTLRFSCKESITEEAFQDLSSHQNRVTLDTKYFCRRCVNGEFEFIKKN